MKKLSFALCLIIALFCSCQNDNDDILKDDKNLIIGEWNLSRVELCDNNGKVIWAGIDAGEIYTHLSFSDATLIATIDYDADDIESYLYQIKGNTISLIDGSWVINYNIEKLSKKELVITHPIDRYIYDPDTDSNVYFEGIARVHYKKQ